MLTELMGKSLKAAICTYERIKVIRFEDLVSHKLEGPTACEGNGINGEAQRDSF